MKPLEKISMIIIAVIITTLLLTFLIMWLWNWLTFLQSLGLSLLLLCGFLGHQTNLK